MDQKFVRYFASLREEVEAATKGASADIVSAINDISQLCEELNTDQDISLALATIFDPATGLFKLVDSLSLNHDRTVQKGREACLVFIADFIRKTSARVTSYSVYIKERCLSLFQREDSKSVQAATLLPLIAVLELCMQKLVSINLCIDWTTACMFLQEYRKAKSSGTLRSNILIVLGDMVECFPGSFEEDNVITIVNVCLDSLDEQVRQRGKDPVYVLVAGAIKCLDALLTWFPNTIPAGGSVEDAGRVYAYLEQVIHFREDLKRYEMVKAGLRLLARHARLFRIQLLEDCMIIFRWLEAYCIHVNAQLRDAALQAFNEFISQVANCLVSGDPRVRNAQDMYKKLVAHALGILDAQDANPKMLSLAIRTVAKLSPVILKFSGKPVLQEAFQRMVSIGSIAERATESEEESLGYSVTLVDAFANIIVNFSDVDNYVVTVLTQALGKIFYGYPYLFPKQKPPVYASVQNLFVALSQKGAIFPIFLTNIVWSSLERSIEPSKGSSAETDAALWKSYSELWENLLGFQDTENQQSHQIDDIKETPDNDIGADDYVVRTGLEELRKTIFDTIIKCIMKAMKELNLKYKVKLTNPSQMDNSDTNIALEPDSDNDPIEPLNEVDMKKFLNLVEFVRQLLSCQFASFFQKWVYPFSRCLVDLSSSYPLLSGFYKLLDLTIRIADQQCYFGTAEIMLQESSGSASKAEKEGESVSDEERALCQDLLQKYLEEVLISSRRYKLELLASCLHLCLSAPPALISIAALVEPIKVALKMGLRFSPLADVAMNALERWIAFRKMELECHLHDILPFLDSYLYLTVSSISESKAEESEVGKAPVSQLRRIRRERMETAQPDKFRLIQIRMLKLLGRIGRHAHLIVPDVNLLQVSGTGGLAWDTTDQVKYTLPFRDNKADTWLDPLLPRIVDLALWANDRRTKVAASELLHALCLLMIGNAAKGPARRQNRDSPSVHYEKTYRKIFPALIRLAADIEQVARELFSRLVMQIIHWFTSNVQKENPDTMALLDSILEGLVDGESAALREFCADCFEEFMRWSIRHTAPEVDNFVNVTSMLRRLYNRLDHPNPYHRLGATMACSRLYRVLRENKSIVDRHILEMLFFCVKSLCIAEVDHEQIGTTKQLNKVLDDLLKLVRRNIGCLVTRRRDRAMFVEVDQFLGWLFKQTLKTQERCCSSCMWLFASICEVLPNGSPAGWFKLYRESQDFEPPFKLFNTTFNIQATAGVRSTIKDMEHSMVLLSRCLHWFEWALQINITTLEEIMIEAPYIKSPIEDLVVSLLKASSYNIGQFLTPKEVEQHEELRWRAVICLLRFSKEILYTATGTRDESIQPYVHAASFTDKLSTIVGIVPINSPSFVRFLCLLLLAPWEVGFTLIQYQKHEHMVRLSMKLIKLMVLISKTWKQVVVHCLQELLVGGTLESDTGNLGISINDVKSGNMKLEHAKCLLRGYQELLLVGILHPVLGNVRSSCLGERLLKDVFMLNECSSALQTFGGDVLSLSISLGVNIQKLLDHVFDQTPVAHSSPESSNLTSGSLFYLNFRKVIIWQVKFSYKECLSLLLMNAQENYTARLLVSALLDDYLCTKTGGNTITVGSFINEFLLHLSALRSCCIYEAPYSDKLFFLEVLQKLLMLDTDSQTVLSPAQPSFQFIIDSFFSCLMEPSASEVSGSYTSKLKNMDLVVQNNALVLVPFFFRSGIGGSFSQQFTTALTRIVTNYLLVREVDLPAGSNQRALYIQTLDKILEAVCFSKHPLLLEVLFPIFQNCTSIAKKRVLKSLKQYASNIEDERSSICDLCLDVLRDGSKVSKLKQAVIELVFIPLVEVAPSSFVLAWYADHMKSLFDAVSQKHNQPKQNAEEEEDCLIKKICHYKMISLLFRKVGSSLIKDTITAIVSNQQLMQVATNDSRAKNDPEIYLFPDNAELWRELHSQSYNCLAAVVMCTQEQEKIFTILFKDFAGRPLWQHLVDCTKLHDNFPVEMSQLGLLGELTRNLRSERKSLRKKDGTIQFLSSQYIVGATLNQEPTVVDSFIGAGPEKEPQVPDDDEIGSSPKDASEVEMDMMDDDYFDHHPCLPVILTLIAHLHSKFHGSQEMPEWMKALHSTLSNAGTPVNICLFIVKIVIKARKVFKQFASQWIEPILQPFLRYPESTGGRSFHYMLRDLCITILDWNLQNLLDSNTASRFLNYLMEVTPHQSNQVLRANLEITRNFLSRWKDFVTLDMNIILSFLTAGGKSPSSTDKLTIMRRTVGLQLLGTVASVGLPLYDDSPLSKLTEKDLIGALLSNVSFKVKNVYEASAELLGMILKQRTELQHERHLEAPLKHILLTLFRDGEMAQFLTIMEKITVYFPAFLEGYSSMLFDLLPRVHGFFRVLALSIILRCSSCIPNLFSMILPYLSKFLTHRDEFAQIKSLQLVAELVKEASPQTITDQVLPVLSETFSMHDSVECRKHYYEILIYLYTTRKMEGDELLTRSLLLGASDESILIKECIQSFWHGQLAASPQERFLEVITRLYDPIIEDCWVSTGNALLLKLCEDAVDFKRPIFSAPLSDCEFKEYTLGTSLLSGTLPMTPMFSSTQEMSSQSEIKDSEGADDRVTRYPGMIRGTLPASASVTMSQGQSFSTFSSREAESSLFALSQRLVRSSLDATVEGTQVVIDSTSSIKRRLVHPSASRPQILRSILNSAKRREARLAQQALERANKVQIMRRYRIGDLPDIEIKNEEIIRPLVALAERDSTFSRLLLTLLCRAIYSLSVDQSHDSKHDIKSLVTESIGKALEKTANSISFVSCALSICLEDKEAWIDPKVIGSASSKSTNFQSGILLLENSILQGNVPWQYVGNTRKRHKGVHGQITRQENDVEQAWWELAGLYRSIGENDIVLSIFKSHLSKASITHHALEAELGGDIVRALELYDKAIDQFDEGEGTSVGAGDLEQDLWWTRRLHCMASLLNWHEVMNEILFQVGQSSLERLWEPKMQASYLSLFIRAAIKMPTHHLMLTDFLQPISDDLIKKELILNIFSTEVATLAISNDQLDLARFYIHESYKSFLKHWTESHPLATSARHLQIKQLQKATELNEFLDLASTNQHGDCQRLLGEWRTRWPSTTMDDAEAWDDIVHNRILCFQKLQSALNKGLAKGQEQEGNKFAFKLDDERAYVFYEAARGLMKQGNCVAAKGYMNQFVALRDSRKERLDFPSYKNIVKLRCLEAFYIHEVDSEKAFQMLHQVLSYIRSTMQKQHQQKEWQRGLKLLEGRTCGQLGWLLVEQTSKQDSATEESIGKCLKILGLAFDAYSHAVKDVENHGVEIPAHTMAKSLLRFSFFCDELLKSAESAKWGVKIQEAMQKDDGANLPPASTYPSLVVKYMMTALQVDSSVQAHHGIARVLTLVGQYTETCKEFITASQNIARWLFIPWIPQMLAVIDKDEGEGFISILEDIARLYPQAIYFAYNVSKQDFGPAGLQRAKHLEKLLESPVLESLVRGLEDLSFPEQRLRDGLAWIKNCLGSGNQTKAKEVFNALFEDCLDVDSLMKGNRQSGEYNIKFAREYAKRVTDAVGQGGVKLLSMDEKQFTHATNSVMANLQKALKTLQTGSLSLNSFSKWMADFDQARDTWSTQEDTYVGTKCLAASSVVHMFGSFHGFQEPDLGAHIKLVSFDQTIISLNSKQRPKVLKVRGSDEHEYKFIVKGGEDLRLDQRIEQLFDVMNSILSRDPSCSQRKLCVRTYAVIPVSRQCGLLQFVENTQPLDDVIKDGLACTLPALGQPGKTAPLEVMSNVRIKFQEWLEKRGGAQNLADCYKNMYSKVHFDEIADKMNTLISGIPWDTLRNGLFKLTTSAESFIALRSQYQHSLAVLSVCGYIAGVGDRHLSNILVDMKGGSLVPIDFGYSFGTGVILLPVPELIPFRLTRQLANVLLPQDALGLLRNDMVHVMTALRSSKDVISAVMGVFVKEPLLDWKTEAMKTMALRNIESGTSMPEGVDPQASNEQRHVALKVDIAHRKLDLWNPAEITIAELQSSVHAGKPYMPSLETIIRGNKAYNIRARTGSFCESVQEQIDCLIDQATDPNLLGRIWLGWQPWI